MAKTSHHVILDPRGGWSVRKGGARRASRHFETKEDAVIWGKGVSRRQGTEFVIHRRDGTVEEKDRPSLNSAPPKEQSCMKSP